MSEVFADSFYFIAILHPRDQFHAAAVEQSQHRPGDHHFTQAGFVDLLSPVEPG